MPETEEKKTEESARTTALHEKIGALADRAVAMTVVAIEAPDAMLAAVQAVVPVAVGPATGAAIAPPRWTSRS